MIENIYLIMMVVMMSDIDWKDFQIGGKAGVFAIKSSISEIDKKT